MAKYYGSVGVARRSDGKYTVHTYCKHGSQFRETGRCAVNDLFISTKDGSAFKCTTAGWYGFSSNVDNKALFTKETNLSPVLTPDAPTNLTTPVRGSGHTFTTKWTAFKTDGKNAKRPTSVISKWTVSDGYYRLNKTDTLSAGASSASFNLAEFTSDTGKRYTRSNFYPFSGGRKVTSITNTVYARNDAPNPYGKEAKTTIKLGKPRKPSITGWSFNKTNGEVTFHIKTNAGTDKQERYDTRYIVKVLGRDGIWREQWNTSSTSTDISRTFDVSDYSQLTYSQYIQIKVEAWARGLAGDSEHVTANYYVGFPALATVTKTTINGTSLESRFVVSLKTNSTAEHFVQQVKLEYLPDTEYEYAGDIPGSAVWTDSGLVDDAQCTALSTSVQELIPSAGNYTWFRLKTWCRNEDVLFRYTYPKRIKELETPAPTAQDERIKVLTTQAIDPAFNDGSTVALVLGWNASGTDDADGTELTWSSSKYAWRSTDEPSKHEFTWSDGPRTHGGVNYRDSAVIYVHGLDENVPCYFRARRYKTLEDESVSYSPYSNTFTATPTVITPAEAVSVSVVSDAIVPSGKSYPVSWSYDADVIQAQWQIQASSGTIIASGSGTNQACQIDAARLATFAVNGVVTYMLRVMVSGTWVKSATRTVTIVPVPELTLDVAETLTAQPLTFDMECDQSVSVRLVVLSDGVDGQRPGGLKRQANGDVIYSAMLEPEWTIENNTYSASVELPTDLDFFNNGNYTIEATPVNTYGIEGITQTAAFDIDWAHVAGDPNCEVEVIDQEEENGYHTQAITLTLSAPENAVEGDVYDVYRLTGDGATLIGIGLAQDEVVIDKHAPFDTTTSFVRVATRTADGDTSFFDFEYELKGSALRFDWEDQSVELPYNLTISDGYTKDVDIRKHLDGTQDAYWNSAINRAANYTSTVIDLSQTSVADQVRALARYTGPVFVRTPDGSAFTADVQVTDLTPDGGLLSTVAISATEIDLVESFMLEKVEE